MNAALRKVLRAYLGYFKRLERGRFELPVVDEKRVRVKMEAPRLVHARITRALWSVHAYRP